MAINLLAIVECSAIANKFMFLFYSTIDIENNYIKSHTEGY